MPNGTNEDLVPNGTPIERLDAFEAALAELKEVVKCMPTNEQAERAIRTEDKVGRLLAFAVIPTLLILGLIVIATVATFQARTASRQNYEGVQCLLAEMAAHRVNNNAVNEAIGRAVGLAEADLPLTLLPEADLEKLHETCEQFFPRQSLGQP